MLPALRILHTADAHIGADLPVRAGGKYARRGSDFVTSFQRVLARAGELGANLVIIAGDLFDRSQPRDGAVVAATRPIWDLACSGVPVVLLPGNHERSVLPNALLLSHPNIHILRAPATIGLKLAGRTVAVAGFPCLRRKSAHLFAHSLAATGWDRVHADVKILAVHQTFEGATCGPGNFRFRAGDDVVPRVAIPAGFDYIAAGHIHRHQVLPRGEEGAPIVYCGSPDRIALAEIGEPKGFVLAELAAGRMQVQFIEHAVRPMVVVPRNITGLSGPQCVEQLLTAVAGLPPAAVAQIRLSGQTARSTLAGLKLTEQIRAIRPDVAAFVTTQAVEWVSPRRAFRLAHQPSRSAFDVLDAPATPVTALPIDRLKELPDGCGTYALYDSAGRLLYIGKALHGLTRIRTHLRSAVTDHFSGWTRQIARLEFRPAASELEALLVEADLIRRLSPPFNTQMRAWRRYCYLCDAAGARAGVRAGARAGAKGPQLAVRSEPQGRFVFGPLRSRAQAEEALEALSAYFGLARCPDSEPDPPGRPLPPAAARLCSRYFAGQCAGPCAGRIADHDYAAHLQAARALLAGTDAPSLDAELAAADSQPARERMLTALASLSARAVLLRAARELLNVPIRMPGAGSALRFALIGPGGLRIWDQSACPTAAGADAPRAPVTAARGPGRLALPKPVADLLCIAVQQIRRRPEQYTISRAASSPPQPLAPATT
ncbi:MAG: metallophosphoesterase [Planctomycetota bacterium]